MAARCGALSPRRLERLVWRENHPPPDFDGAPLVVDGCVILEGELTRLLADPARALGPVLLRAVEGRAARSQRDVLEKWLAGRAPVTLGTVELILYALRQGLARRLPEVTAFLDESFLPGYARLLGTNGPGRCLAKLRQDFRNPAAHGGHEVSAAEYERFCRLAVGSISFRAWVHQGPRPDPPADDEGLLHHHLAYRQAAPADGPDAPRGPGRQALLRLRTPPGSPVQVRVAVAPVRPGAGPHAFRVGECIRFTLEVGVPCSTTLISLPEDGDAVVLFPNRHRPDGRLPHGVTSFPDPHSPECELPLEGPPGTETVLALATRGPLGIGLLPAGPEPAVRTLSDADLAELARALAALPAGEWAASVCRFEVRP
jgi:hypothetical protein